MGCATPAWFQPCCRQDMISCLTVSKPRGRVLLFLLCLCCFHRYARPGWELDLNPPGCLWCLQLFSLQHLTAPGPFNQSYITTSKPILHLCLATVWSFTLIPPSPLGLESPETTLSKWYDSSRLDHFLCLQEPCTGSALPFLLKLPSSILGDLCQCGLRHWNHG